MFSRKLCLLAGLSSAMFTLSACGGAGGNEEVANIPPPPPPPPPAEYEKVSIFPDVTTSTTFAAAGAEMPADGHSPVATEGFAVRYDADTKLYVFDLPSGDPGGFYSSPAGETDSSWNGGLSTRPAGMIWPPTWVLKPSSDNPTIQLTYTSMAGYLQAGPMEDLPHGFVAFGIPTPQGAVPVTGSASYKALVAGASVDGMYSVAGDATMQFNFGNGTLAGHLDPKIQDFYALTPPIELGTYAFVNTIYGVGSTTFSGQMSNDNVPGMGTFSGQFTGPNAEELLSNWTAPFRNPASGQTSTIFGVWVGKKD